MSCGKNSGCYNLYAVTYPKLKSSVDSNYFNILSSVSNVKSSIGRLKVSDDYLGEKITAKLQKIKEGLEDSITDISSDKANVDNFISEKESEHQSHYEDWLRAKELEKDRELGD